MSKDTQVPAQETQNVQPETPTEEKKEQEVVDQPIGDVLQTESKKEDTKKPEFTSADFMAVKTQNKELKKALKDLEKRIEDGASNNEISSDIDSIAEEYNVDSKFLKKLEGAIKSKLEGEIEERVSSKLKPLEEKEKEAKLDKVFSQYYDDAMGRMPDEYKDIVNRDVIKALSLQPHNSRKTLPQLIEETYGRAIVGRKTIETTTHRGGVDPTKVDIDLARKDPAYFKEVMANPELKKQYNEGLAQRSLR